MAISPYLGREEGLLAPGRPGTRSRDSFDFGWKFLKGDAEGAQLRGFSDDGWRDVDIPHDWSIEGPFSEKEPSAGSGAYLPTWIGWYRKRFRIETGDRGKLVTLEFDGVYQNSEVWINGHYLGLRPYGYVSFAYELTPHLNVGGENVVAVKVDNSLQTNCRWYSGSGIYRHTWLLKTNPLHVAYWGTFVTCTRVSKEAAIVEVKTRVANHGKAGSLCALTTELVAKDGRVVGTQQSSQTIGAQGEYEFVQRMTVDKPSLWSPGNPYLYVVRSSVREGGQVADIYDTPMGIREAVFDAKRGFLLNGERIKLNGACLHQDAGCVGSAVPGSMWERRLALLQEMGCNAIRTSHNPYAAEFLDMCDRMGFLVMNEAFDEWKVAKGIRSGYHLYFDEWYERDLLDFIHRDRNHPSVVLWSAGNEVPDQGSAEGTDTLRKLLRIFHAEDPTRAVTVACDHIASEPASETVRPEFLAQLDVVGYNYVDRWRERAQLYYGIDHDEFPQRPVIGTESSGMGGIRGDYRSLFPASPAAGDVAATPTRRAGRTGAAIDAEQLWKFVGAHDYVSGDFMWTAIDYLGEASWPAKASSGGAIDTCGFKKDGFYFYQSQWTAKPMVHLFPHWNWKGREGQFIPVTCYTNCDTVELFINGRSVGLRGYEFPRYGMQGRYGNYGPRARAQRTTADLHLAWDVPYEPGILKAVGTKDGAAVVTMDVSTTGEPAAVRLSADRAKIVADGRDVAHIVVEILDAQGRIVPVAENEIAFEVVGEGKLVGVDNGNPQNHDGYKVSHCKAFNGMCLAVVQATAKAGRIRVSATSANLRSDAVSIVTKV